MRNRVIFGCKYTGGGQPSKSVIYLIGVTILNILLLQTWIPHSSINVSLNGVAWYLSVTMFLYFLFPYIKKHIQKKKKSTLIVSCVVILVFEIISCVPWILFMGSKNPSYTWFMYCFPLFRFGDFYVGCCVSKCYGERILQSGGSFIKYSIYEIAAILLTILVCVWEKQKYSSPFLTAMQNWTTLYIPLAVIWVILFIKENGIITKVLTNKVTIFIGNISAYTFLIHYVVTRYVGSALNFLNIELSFEQNIIKIIIEFICTIIIAVVYRRLKISNGFILQSKNR